MEKGIRICKVCGKEYEYCHTLLPGVFRWQDVGCCIEHAEEYFEQIRRSREVSNSKKADDNMNTQIVDEDWDDEFEDEEDDDFFDDEDDEDFDMEL